MNWDVVKIFFWNSMMIKKQNSIEVWTEIDVIESVTDLLKCCTWDMQAGQNQSPSGMLVILGLWQYVWQPRSHPSHSSSSSSWSPLQQIWQYWAINTSKSLRNYLRSINQHTDLKHIQPESPANQSPSNPRSCGLPALTTFMMDFSQAMDLCSCCRHRESWLALRTSPRALRHCLSPGARSSSALPQTDYRLQYCTQPDLWSNIIHANKIKS